MSGHRPFGDLPHKAGEPDPCSDHRTNQLNCEGCTRIRQAFYEAIAAAADPGPVPDEPSIDDGQQLIIGIGPGVWAEVGPIDLTGRIVRAALLPDGTAQNHPSVEVLIELADGRLVHANTTWRLWQAATNAFGTHESTWEE